MTELLGVDEVPHRPVIDLQAAFGEFGHQPAQGEIRLPASLHQPITMLSRNLLRLVATDLVRFDAAGLAKALYPQNCRADAYAKLRCRLMARQAALKDSPNNALTKVK